jgi:hypothetical protein
MVFSLRLVCLIPIFWVQLWMVLVCGFECLASRLLRGGLASECSLIYFICNLTKFPLPPNLLILDSHPG